MRTLIHIAIILLILGPPALNADAFTISVPGNSLFNVRVRSMVALRFKKVVRQGYDVSCGAASLATLLKYYYGKKEVSEKQLIGEIIKVGDREKIKKYGFSLLELKRYAESRGYRSGGFKIKDVNKLAQLKVPAITMIRPRGYAHFVVLKGMSKGQIYYADPAFGNRSKPMEEFAKEWSGVILVVASNKLPAKSAFEMVGATKAPVSDVILLQERGFRSSIIPGPGEF